MTEPTPEHQPIAPEQNTAPSSPPQAAAPPATVEPGKESESWLVSLQSLAGTLVIALFVITFLAQAFQIPSQSMEETLLIGDYLLVDKVRYGDTGGLDWLLPYREVERGDIIVFRYPLHPSQHFVKRVVAIPGDRLRIVDKKVFVNGQPVEEPYTVFRGHDKDSYRDDFPQVGRPVAQVDAFWFKRLRRLVEDGELVVPEGKYFALGDNRDESLDSRYWGFVPRESIIGRPLLIYWSMDTVASVEAAAIAEDGKLQRFGHQLLNFPKHTRWDRTFRIIR